MAELKFAIVFSAIDQASAAISRIGAELDAVSKRAQTASERWNATATRWKDTGKKMVVSGAEIAAPGAVVALGFRSVIKAAAEMQGEMAHVATAMNDGAKQTQHLAEVQQFVATTAQHGVVGEKELAEAYYIARSSGADHAAALATVAAANELVTATTKDAAAAQAAMVDTTRTLTGLHNIYGISVNRLSDVLGELQTKYAFQNITEITDALKYVAPAAHGAQVPINTMAAGIAVLSQNMNIGGQAGEMLRQILLEFPKGGAHGRLLPFIRQDAQGNFLLVQSFQALREHIAKLGPTARIAFLTQAGFQARSITGALDFIEHLDEISKIQKDLDTTRGATHAADMTRMAAADAQWARLRNSIEVFRATLGERLLPIATKLIDHFNDLVIRVTNFVEKHPQLTMFAAKVLAIGAGLSLVGGALSIVTGGFLMTGSAALKTGSSVAWAISKLNFGAISRALPSVIEGFMKLTIVTVSLGLKLGVTAYDATIKLATGIASLGGAMIRALPSIYSFGAALLANPLTWYIAAAVALGLAAYEIYKHWGVLASFFKRVGSSIKASFSEIIGWMKNTGLDMMKSLGEGILAGIEYPFKAAWGAAKKIGDLFHFHSLPVEGPLREAIINFRFGEELARHFAPGPVIAPAREMAAGLATAAVPHAATTASAASPPINFNVSYTVNAASPQEWVKAARQHADELMRIIDSKLNRRRRLAFE